MYEEKGIHYYEDGHFWMEMPGLQEAEDEPNIPVKQNTKVTFSQGPIKVNTQTEGIFSWENTLFKNEHQRKPLSQLSTKWLYIVSSLKGPL